MEKLLILLARLLGVTALVPAIGLAMVAVVYYTPELLEPEEPAFFCGTVDSPLPPREGLGGAVGLLFDSNCAHCHGLREIVVGPDLAGSTRRLKRPL